MHVVVLLCIRRAFSFSFTQFKFVFEFVSHAHTHTHTFMQYTDRWHFVFCLCVAHIPNDMHLKMPSFVYAFYNMQFIFDEIFARQTLTALSVHQSSHFAIPLVELSARTSFNLLLFLFLFLSSPFSPSPSLSLALPFSFSLLLSSRTLLIKSLQEKKRVCFKLCKINGMVMDIGIGVMI